MPFGQVSRRLLLSYFGINHGGDTCIIDDSPNSTMVSRTSALLWPTKAIGKYGPCLAR